MIEKIITDFLLLWITIDPIGTVAIFTALTATMTLEKRRTTALKATLYAGGVLIGAIIIGQLIMVGMGIRMISLQVAGGVVLFLFALKMIFSDFDADKASPEGDRDIAVFPLAIPAIATPGAIMAVILQTDNNAHSLFEQAVTGIALVVVLVITYVMMRLSDPILKIIGKNGAALMVKVMGMILAALSVEVTMKAIGIAGWLGPATS